MQDVGRVRDGKSLQDLKRHGDRVRRRKPAVTGDSIANGLAPEPLHHEEWKAVVDLDPVHVADLRAPRAKSELRLTAKSSQARLRHRMDRLQRDLRIRREIHRPVDGAHAARSEYLAYVVTSRDEPPDDLRPRRRRERPYPTRAGVGARIRRSPRTHFARDPHGSF